MKKILLIVTILILTLSVFAQYPTSPIGKQGQKMPDMGHIYGKITDSNNVAVNGASVILMQSKFDTTTKKKKEVLLKAIITKANGEFSFSDLPVFEKLSLRISATGYKPINQIVSFQMKIGETAGPKGSAGNPMPEMAAMNNFDKDLGNIKMANDVKELSSITIVATKPFMKLDIDKKVFNVDKNIVSAGGTALDVMKNVPSVQVDIDGNVALRNATPQIYIDGRVTTLTLDQIPADAIESVEVITNPSAKYDASGGNTGIINIVLKKNKKSGYNGNVRAGVDKRGAVNGGADFNVRQGKLNFTASAMINQNKSSTTGTTNRLSLFGDPQTSVYQINNNKTSGEFMFGRLGLDYFITNRTTLSVAGIKVHGGFNPNETIKINTDSLFNTGKISTYNERFSTGKREFNANGLQLGMKHLFPKEGEELTADLNYFTAKNDGNSLYTTNYYSTIGDKTGYYQQQLINSGTNRFMTIQTDYVKPFQKVKLETGIRIQLRKLSNINDNYILNQNTTQFELIQSATSNYKNYDNVYAAYVSLSSTIKNFGYKLGLRAESSEYKGTLINSGTDFSNKYPVSLFPSLFLSEKLKNKQELQFSVTRRVNRPNFFQLIPFIDYTDNLNITKGNPDLKPEFTQSFELSYSKTFPKNNNLLASLYYKKTTDLITRYQDKGTNPITGTDVLINTFVNANSSQAYGAELTSVNYLAKWVDISTNVNLYNSKINTNNLNGNSQASMWSLFTKFNSNFKLPAKFVVQFSATYQSKTNLPVNTGGGGMGPGGPQQAQSSAQGYIKPNYGFDIAVKKTFMKNDAASLTLSVNDIFKTRKSEQYSYSEYFIQDYSRIRDPQMVRLNFAYRFGKIDMSLFKRKNTKQDMQGAADGMQQ